MRRGGLRRISPSCRSWCIKLDSGIFATHLTNLIRVNLDDRLAGFPTLRKGNCADASFDCFAAANYDPNYIALPRHSADVGIKFCLILPAFAANMEGVTHHEMPLSQPNHRLNTSSI